MKLNVEQQNQVIKLTPMAKKLGAKFGRGLDEEEAVGLALMHLCRAVPSFVPDLKLTLESFVELSIKNLLKNWRREVQKERERGLSGGAVMARDVTNTTACGLHVDHSDVADQGGCSRDLGQSLGKEDQNPELRSLWSELFNILPLDLRQVAYDKWLMRKTHTEIARELGMSVDKVDRRIKKAETYAKLYLNGGTR